MSQGEGVLQEGGVANGDEPVIRIENDGDDANVSGIEASRLHLEDPLPHDDVHQVEDGG